ncbi:GMC family oxidoreductase [Kribbella sp. CWNU-51]
MNTFDYIVVGGGTAGSVVAARLSQDPGISVLLIEAGSAQPSEGMAGPTAWPRLAGTSVDWSNETVPQRGLDGAILPWTRGKVLGGSSGINGMMHIRGDRSAYDAWKAAGASGWNYEALLPYLKRSERAGGDPRYRGKDGPMRVGPAPGTDPLWDACFVAAVQAGHPRNEDSNGETAIGVAWNDMTVVNGNRQSAANAYLVPVLGRPNLTVVADARARRLVLDGAVCRGVEYVVAGQVHTATADRELILTAGAIGSPHLLLLSGIGPAAQLREFGIEVAAALPGVGANLQDHPKSQVAYSATRRVASGVYARKPHVLLRSEPSAAPDLQIILIEAPVHPRWAPRPDNGYSVVFALMTPASRGSVRLASTDPDQAPLIDPGFLTDRDDVVRMTAGLRAAREIGSAQALADVRDKELFPGSALQSDAESYAYLRSTVTSYFHPAGTCAIGDSRASVVDTSLAVHGIAHLRIADASVMPTLVSGNTNAATLANAERAAALITGEEAVPPR